MTPQFLEAAIELGLQLTPEQLEQFDAFEARLYEANAVMNLTRVPREECWLRHFLDSLLIAPLIPSGASVLDIGCGPGFPSWPLACARPDLRLTALDSSNKMAGFLRANPLPNLSVEVARAEDWGHRETFDFVTGRAVAPLALQLELSAAPCKRGGQVVPMRTPSELEAIQYFPAYELGLKLVRIEQKTLFGTDIIRVFPIFEKAQPTLKPYPRSWAEMKKKPLA